MSQVSPVLWKLFLDAYTASNNPICCPPKTSDRQCYDLVYQCMYLSASELADVSLLYIVFYNNEADTNFPKAKHTLIMYNSYYNGLV